ncbi:MAG: AbrB/MazE/SpoVT family DNA-binding domain-containing protein [Methanobacteriaceae archaeon]|jgi:AbrB family looped-hinge helix DNA binding protein|nr:AbrB/MazE/SpoVT family DNA-binding domain-containing protein [Methanobacteriaceae archaeon]MDO9627132.1 AbrB/MazE/SpoVT family DNA-binding domain-containing protein [Methanobacteriaceae archaeon]
MVSVTKKFQVTIPKDVREDLNIQSGDKVVFVKNNNCEWVIMTVKSLAEMMVCDENSKNTDSGSRQSFTTQLVK